MNINKTFYILFIFLTNIVSAQTGWHVDSFAVVHSVDFEDNSLGNYSSNQSEWEDDWNSTWRNLGDDGLTNIIQKGSTKCMELWYLEGSVDGVNQGIDFTVNIPGMNADSVELYLSYDIMFKPGFDFVISGKFGAYMQLGQDWSAPPEPYHGAPPDYEEGGRFMNAWWDQSSWLPTGNAAAAWYIFHHDASYGDGKAWYDPYSPWGFTLFHPAEEEWINVTVRMVCNTVNTPPADGNYDGYAEAFINGRWVERWDGFRMRNVDSIGLNQLVVYSRFGGSGSDFSPTRDEWMLNDNFYVWTYAPGVTSVPRYYEHSDSSRILSIPQAWTNVSLDYSGDTMPQTSGIPSQTIDAGESFSTIALDNYVYDGDHADNELSWEIKDTNNIEASQTDRVVTLTYSDWTGTEYIKFVVTDPNGNADSTITAFTVNDTTGSGVGVGQTLLINTSEEDENKPPSTIGGQYWNHLGWLEHDIGDTNTLYNTDGENSGFKLTGQLTGTMYTGNYGYTGTDYPDTCEYSFWRVNADDDPVTMDIIGFTIGEEYKLKLYSSYTGSGNTTEITLLDTAKTIDPYENDSIFEWVWTADAEIETITLETPDEYGYAFINVIEIEEFEDIAEETDDTLAVTDTLFAYQLYSLSGSHFEVIESSVVIRSFDSLDYGYWSNVDFGDSCYFVKFSHITHSSYPGPIMLTLDSLDGDTILTTTLTPTGDSWYALGTQVENLEQLVSGVHDLYIQSLSDDATNVEWILFFRIISRQATFRINSQDATFRINQQATTHYIRE